MANKVLLIALVLLWIMPQFMAWHSLKAKYQLMQRINYRNEDEIINEPLSCTALKCMKYKTEKDGLIDLTRQIKDTGIQYRHQKKEEIKGYTQTSSLT